MNTKLHAICDSEGRPLNLFVTAGQVSDYIGARALLSSIPNVDWLLGPSRDIASQCTAGQRSAAMTPTGFEMH